MKIQLSTKAIAFICLLSMVINMRILAEDTKSDTEGHKPVTVTVRVPQPGIYAVSVVDKDIVSADNVQPSIVKTMLDNSLLLKSINEDKTTNDKVKQHFDFETEQIISGDVKRVLKKVKNTQIIVFNPVTGERQNYSLGDHQSFNLVGFDVQEGGKLTLQATKDNGRDNLIELHIKEPYFPDLSGFMTDQDALSLPIVNEQKLVEVQKENIKKVSKELYHREIELQEVVVNGSKKIKPMNKFEQSPAKGFTYLDDLLAKTGTMDSVMIRLGLMVRDVDGSKYPGRFISVTVGRFVKVLFITPTIYIDDLLIDNIDELWELDPRDIKQIEYFTEEQQNETAITLKSTMTGAICIFTKPNNLRHNALSMKSIHPLGYRPSVKPYDPLKDSTYISQDDHRVTLLWNPALVVDSTCKALITFMPSSTSKHYDINLEGIGNSGAISCSRKVKEDISTLSEAEESKIAEYFDNTAREKAYIQTDRSQYCPGDTVWLRVHVADAMSIIPTTSPEYPTDRSKFVYVEFHANKARGVGNKNTSDSLIKRIKIKRDEHGVFSSYFVLPQELPSSNITLAAYTRHMLNFPEDQIYHKQIQIVGL